MLDPTKYIRQLTAGQVPASSARPGRCYLSKGGEPLVVYLPSSAPKSCGRRPTGGGVPYKRLGEVAWYGWLPSDYPLTETETNSD